MTDFMLRRPAHGDASLTWDGTAERSREIDNFTRDASYLARWHWRPGVDETARLRVNRGEQGEEWVIVPVGADVVQVADDMFEVRTPDDGAAEEAAT